MAAPLRFDEPLTLPCGLVLRNRVIRAAAFAGGGVDEQATAHAEVAAGGVALTTIAYTSVSPDGRTFASQLLLTADGAPQNLHNIARAVHAHGALLSYQLTHAGSFADVSIPGSGVDRTVAPSPVFELATMSRPRAATDADMDRLVADFAAAATVAVGPGEADAVEVHLGHGYLLSQWLSPKTNRREDSHGGSAEARMRFPLRVVRAVRAAVGPRHAVFVKLNVSDGFRGGVTPADVASLVRALVAEPGLVDGIVPSAGFVSRNGFYMLRGDVPRAGMVRRGGASGGQGEVVSLGVWAELIPRLPCMRPRVDPRRCAPLRPRALPRQQQSRCWAPASCPACPSQRRSWPMRGQMRSSKRLGAAASPSLRSEATALWHPSRLHSPQATGPCKWPAPSSESPNSCSVSGQQWQPLPLRLQRAARRVRPTAQLCRRPVQGAAWALLQQHYGLPLPLIAVSASHSLLLPTNRASHPLFRCASHAACTAMLVSFRPSPSPSLPAAL